MTIHIHFSHQDKSFADKLVSRLGQSKLDCCIELWEFSEGESLIETVKNADDGSAILVVLSKESVSSEWCQQLLSAGLLHELDEKRAVVIPVLIDDCIVPELAQGKRLAVFRAGNKFGMRAIVEEVAKVGISAPRSDAAMSLDWCNVDDKLVVIFSYNYV